MQPHRLTHLASLAVLAALIAVLLAGCGASSPSSSTGSASTGSTSFQANLAYAQCMRAHGLSRFPNPSPSQGFSFGGQLNGNPNSPAARANDACKHLLSRSSTGMGGTTTSPTSSPPGAVAADCLTSQPPCYTPQQLRVAYGIQPLLDRGITGRGQTVVLLEFLQPRQDPRRRLPASRCRRLPTSGKTWHDLAACSACPPRGCRL